jgi:hypothetical protein
VLRARGLFWDDYAVPGGTLRENYNGVKGQNRLDSSHPGAKFFWKAGEEIPAYARDDAAADSRGKKLNRAKRGADMDDADNSATGAKRIRSSD